MGKDKPITHTWDENLGLSIAEQIIDDKTHRYVRGVAQAAPEDQEFANEYTGMTIAELRMGIDLARQHIELDLRPQLFILNHLLGTMKHSKKFNPKSYEATRIYQERQNILDDIDQFKSYIATTKKYLKQYIAEKDKFYRNIEKGRK